MANKTPWHRDIGGGKSRSYMAPAAGSRPKAPSTPNKQGVTQPSRRTRVK